MMEAVLLLSGEVGYRGLALADVADRAGIEVEESSSDFPDLASCFAAAYEAEAEALAAALVQLAAAAGDWRRGFRAAITALFRFAAEYPATTKALFREVHVAGGAALARRDEIVDRLSTLIERSWRASFPELPEPSPVAASFVVGVIEGVLRGRLLRGGDIDRDQLVSELMFLIVGSFMGSDAAREELDR